MRMNYKVFVVDDDLEMGRVVKDLLTEEGCMVTQFSSAAEALVHFKKEVPHVLITDNKMKEIDGLMFLKKVQADYPEVVSLMMTAFGSIDTAIEAMRAGAYHYIVKPFKNEELILLVRRAIEKSKLKQENKVLKRELNKSFNLDAVVGKSPAMIAVFDLVKLVATSAANVLITGESGSGKELVARALHNLGPRSAKPFVPLNCAAIPEALLESELFGHVKGAFTGAVTDKIGLFELANKGSLFLDEIGDLSLPLQAKLLRVLQDKEIRPVGGQHLKSIDVRIIAATHRDLRAMVQAGTFREDLFYRLNVVPIRVPPLRERMGDLPLLIERFISKFAVQNDSRVKSISPEAMALLMGHSWPGNVRELENIIERAMVLTPGETIEKSVLQDSAFQEGQDKLTRLQADRPSLNQLEERYIKLVLAEVKNDKDEAVKILGISRRTLYRKEQLYGTAAGEPVPEGDEDES